MNWTFHLSCDRIQTNDCIFNPIQRAPPLGVEYGIQLKRVTSPFRSPDVGPSFDILSITTPEVPLPVSTPINCGAKEVVAQVINFTICTVAWWELWNFIVRQIKFNLFLFLCKSCNTLKYKDRFQTRELGQALIREHSHLVSSIESSWNGWLPRSALPT